MSYTPTISPNPNSHQQSLQEERVRANLNSEKNRFLIFQIIGFAIAATVMSLSIFGIVKSLGVPYGSASYSYWRSVGRLSSVGLGVSALITIPLGIGVVGGILDKITSCCQGTAQ